MPYVRTVKTKSGATAVQAVWSSQRGSRQIEHLGSAYDEAELDALKTAARQRITAGQLELDLCLGPSGRGSGHQPIRWAGTALKLALQIVKRPDDLHTFKVLPRRWVVKRTLAWDTRHRRTVGDYERLPGHHETYVYWAMIIVMTRRLARKPAPSSTAPERQVT